MKPILVRIKSGDSGIALIQLALLAVVIMLFTAFAVDLGWFFLNANKIQRAADNAALAGVVYMPDETAIAVDRAERVAEANGYIDGDDGAVLTITPQPDGKKNQLEVTVTDTVQTFFLRVIGRDAQEISRTGRAEYIKPLPMGSPLSQFGNDGSDGIDTTCTSDPCFWANIHGTFTNNQMGDAFSSACEYATGFGGSSPCAPSQYHRTNRGYVYAIDHGGAAFAVQVQNGAFERFDGDGNPIRSGDNYQWCLPASCPDGPTTTFRVFAPDPTPLTLDSPMICEFDFDPVDSIANLPGYDPATDTSYTWTTICGVAAPEPGLYTVEVSIDDDGLSSADDAGLNRYAIRATGGAKLSALGDMSIYNNISGNTEFFLAQVDGVYAGRTFVVEMYDPGDAQVGIPNIIKLLGPTGSVWSGGCTISKREHNTSDFAPLAAIGAGSPCQIDATRPANDYNGDWLRVEIDLPESYSCASCWWKIRYEYSGSVSDTTTWRAFIAGSPVRLVLGG